MDLNYIVSQMTHPEWADSRYKCLDVYDRILDGCFYDHIQHPFFQETEGAGRYIEMHKRRPCAAVNVMQFVVKKVARKLFGGRQKPKIVHDNEELVEAADVVLREGLWDQKVLNVVVQGSIGSTCVVFSILPDGNQKPRVIFDIYRSKYCDPVFDRLGELSQLRVRYIRSGGDFIANGITRDSLGHELEHGARYWYVCDYTLDEVITYLPMTEDLFKPCDPETFKELKPDPDRSNKHNLGMVPAQWFSVKTGCDGPDGSCFWASAINMMITLDYTVSQEARGVWYGLAPQVVSQGPLANWSESEGGQRIVRGPSVVLEYKSGYKDGSGTTIDGGDAHMLETNGAGFREGREFIDQIRKLILEQIAGSRKDPDKLAGTPPSGQAMTVLEDDFIDLVQDLRIAFGEYGMLPLLKKVLRACIKTGHDAAEGLNEKEIDELALQWPRPYPPNPQELLQIMQAMDLASGEPDEPDEPDMPAQAGAEGKPGTPAMKGKKGKPGKPPILTPEEIRSFVLAQLDLPVNEGDDTLLQTPMGQKDSDDK
jgi:hypothetical protein